MGDYSIIQGGPVEGTPLSSNNYPTLTASGSANTKGTWVTLIASTATAGSGLIVTFGEATATHRILIDIGIGAAASEQVIIPNLFVHNQVATGVFQQVLIPIKIAAGTRISARCQGEVGSDIVRAGVMVLSGSLLQGSGLGRVTTYGVSTATTIGTSVDPGGTADTKGAWVQLTASTTSPVRWMAICLNTDSRDQTAASRWLVDVGVGGAGAEQVIIPNLGAIVSASSDVVAPGYYCLPVNVPTGVRLSMRAQCLINTATQRLLDNCVIYGVD